MNKLGIIFLLFTCSVISKAQSIDGVWTDCNSASFSNCTAVFAQKEDSVFVTHYIEFNGQPFVEYGKGTVKGNVYSYHVIVTTLIPGWSTEGDHTLVLSEDGRSLTGYYLDNKGNKGELKFTKLLPSK